MLSDALGSAGALLCLYVLLLLIAGLIIAIYWRMVWGSSSGDTEAKLKRVRGQGAVNRTLWLAAVLWIPGGILVGLGKWLRAGGFDASLGAFIREEHNLFFGILCAWMVIRIINERYVQITAQRRELESGDQPAADAV